jgi:ubiquitin carboxyl-terminal hydrolase 14
MSGTIEKHSAVLGRNAVWNKKSEISRLPPVLCVHMMRFFWKATPDSQDHQGVKCKMLRVRARACVCACACVCPCVHCAAV